MCKFTISIFQFMQNFRADLIDSTKKTLAEQYLIQFSKKAGLFMAPPALIAPRRQVDSHILLIFHSFVIVVIQFPFFQRLRND